MPKGRVEAVEAQKPRPVEQSSGEREIPCSNALEAGVASPSLSTVICPCRRPRKVAERSQPVKRVNYEP